MKLFYSAMLCLFVGLIFVPIGVSFAQNTDKQAIIDSLNNELSKAKEDTNKVIWQSHIIKLSILINYIIIIQTSALIWLFSPILVVETLSTEG